MKKNHQVALLVLFAFQLLISSGFELAHDEAYYWLFSKNLDWGYLDHPPFVAVVIKAFSFLPHSEFAVRVGFIILQFLSGLILYSMTNQSAVSLILFFAFPLASFTGLLALPDIPLLFMTCCYLWQLKRYLEKDDVKNSLSLGAIIALLLYAKYHGVLAIGFTILAMPKLLLRKSFYVVAASAIVLFFPHMYWQYQHDYPSLRYHFLERPSSSFSIKRSLEYLGLQIVLAGVLTGPIVWWAGIKNKDSSSFARILKFISVGTVLFFLFSSFSKKVEANWTIFLAAPLILLCAQAEIWNKKVARNLLLVSCALVVLLRIVFVLPADLAKIKRAREFHGWSDWAQKVVTICETKNLLANSYQIASKLSFYLDQEINALNYHSRKNQFDYWRFDRSIPSKEVCYITDKSEFKGTSIETPEGKTLQIVKNQGLESLWQLK